MPSFAEQLVRPAAKAVRPRTTYDVPESLRDATGKPAKVSMQTLVADDELQAARSGKFDILKSQYEAVKLAIVALDGKPTSVADGTTDQFWNNCDPKLRTILLDAYNRMSSPSREESDAFFKSAQVEV